MKTTVQAAHLRVAARIVDSSHGGDAPWGGVSGPRVADALHRAGVALERAWRPNRFGIRKALGPGEAGEAGLRVVELLLRAAGQDVKVDAWEDNEGRRQVEVLHLLHLGREFARRYGPGGGR